MPKINYMILYEFHFFGILECTVFCAVMHSFLCNEDQSARSIDGFKAIENPPGVFRATAVLSRVSKRAGFIVWLKKKSRKRWLEVNLILGGLKALVSDNCFYHHKLVFTWMISS